MIVAFILACLASAAVGAAASSALRRSARSGLTESRNEPRGTLQMRLLPAGDPYRDVPDGKIQYVWTGESGKHVEFIVDHPRELPKEWREVFRVRFMKQWELDKRILGSLYEDEPESVKGTNSTGPG